MSKWWRAFKIKIVIWIRILRGQCIFCGEPVSVPKDDDFHSHGPYCRKHNKIMNFMRVYGASPQTTERQMWTRSNADTMRARFEEIRSAKADAAKRL